ncbi:hypothetical protein ACFL4O_03480, partial [bacterium]
IKEKAKEIDTGAHEAITEVKEVYKAVKDKTKEVNTGITEGIAQGKESYITLKKTFEDIGEKGGTAIEWLKTELPRRAPEILNTSMAITEYMVSRVIGNVTGDLMVKYGKAVEKAKFNSLPLRIVDKITGTSKNAQNIGKNIKEDSKIVGTYLDQITGTGMLAITYEALEKAKYELKTRQGLKDLQKDIEKYYMIERQNRTSITKSGIILRKGFKKLRKKFAETRFKKICTNIKEYKEAEIECREIEFADGLVLKIKYGENRECADVTIKKEAVIDFEIVEAIAKDQKIKIKEFEADIAEGYSILKEAGKFVLKKTGAYVLKKGKELTKKAAPIIVKGAVIGVKQIVPGWAGTVIDISGKLVEKIGMNFIFGSIEKFKKKIKTDKLI